MIRRLYAAILRWRAAHHAERAQIFAMALNAARERSDFITSAYFWTQFEKARAKRDLLTLKASSMLRRPAPDADFAAAHYQDGRDLFIGSRHR